jgi:hypothetical protein
VISWIVASHHYPTLRDNLGATIRGVDQDEVVVVENATSIAAAYNEGQARATQPIRAYIHHDVRIGDARRLRAELVEHCTPAIGWVGVIGSRNRVLPWWDGERCGSVVDARMGLLDFGEGGTCAYLDGLLLATVHEWKWDESYPGWHWYDHDICEQALDRFLPNWCLTDGHQLVLHNTAGSAVTDQLPGWNEGKARFVEKWGGPDSARRELRDAD